MGNFFCLSLGLRLLEIFFLLLPTFRTCEKILLLRLFDNHLFSLSDLQTL